MIGVITGLPGAGKTLYALSFIKAMAEKEDRPVFYSGIANLTLPWTEWEPEKWMELPPRSIIVVDEAQRVFRPRSSGSAVPKHVSDLETHRHLGIDLFFITQHPMLLDANVRKLCGLHFHVVRGRIAHNSATVHEWPQIKEACATSRGDSVRHDFHYPKESFAWYKSAEVHTHKRRIPYHLYIVLAAPLAVAFAAWRVYSNWAPSAKEPPVPVATSSGPLAAAMSQGGPAPGQGPLTPAQYISRYEPRVRGLDYTAPAFDEVTKPKVAPYPAACVASQATCRCWSQQATQLQMSVDLCRNIASRGFFITWDAAPTRGGAVPVSGAVPLPAAVPVETLRELPSLGSLGSYRGELIPPSVTSSVLTD